MEADIPFIPGEALPKPEPLARFLPPIPSGVAAAWLEANLPSGVSDPDSSWLLDPFGASPHLIVEMARAGYRVLVAANNPISRFLIEMAANTPTQEELRAALAELAASRKGEGRLEPHLRSLYMTTCDQCGKPVMADEFLWDRQAAKDGPILFARIYHCPHCGESGEHPAHPEDVEKAVQLSTQTLHRARALERVAAMEDPDRSHVEEALSTYLPRAVYALFTLVNRLDSLPAFSNKALTGDTAHLRRLLEALLLSAFDQANTLWPYPSGRGRPRQLTIPPRFREKNIWLALEEAVERWGSRPGESSDPVALTLWPDLPPPSGGICLFEGRLKDLAELIRSGSPVKLHVGAVLAALPRPNQAFWTLSALWAGWLWGREAVGPFKSVLRRRRYDWGWHSNALHAALDHLSPLLETETPFLRLIGEAEPGFLSAALISAQNAEFELSGIALRVESGQAQILWKRTISGSKFFDSDLHSSADVVDLAAQAARDYLLAKNEPAVYLQIYSAALQALEQAQALRAFLEQNSPSGQAPSDIFNRIHSQIEEAFSYRRGFLRYGGSEKSLEVGQWWLRDPIQEKNNPAPLADRIEVSLVNRLLKEPGLNLLQLDSYLCKEYPGLFTPELGLIQLCLSSYSEQRPSESGLWRLRQSDSPKARRKDLKISQQWLEKIASRLGYAIEEQNPLVIKGVEGEVKLVCYLAASAVVGNILLGSTYPPQASLIVLPDERSGLLAYKLSRDLRLRKIIEEGWRFIDYRQLGWLADHPSLTAQLLDEQLALGLPEFIPSQMRML